MNITKIITKIQERGFLWVMTKVLKRGFFSFLRVPLDLIALCLVLLIRLVKPLVTIRIGCIDIGRIGGSYNAFWNLDQQNHSQQTLDIYYFLFSTNHFNAFWKKIWKELVFVFPFHRLGKRVDEINQKIPGGNIHNAVSENWPPSNSVITSILSSEDVIRYQFSNEEERLGAEMIDKLGLSKEGSFVCYSIRDSAFLDKMSASKDWTYHDFRDADIKSYVPSMQEIIRKNKSVVRMGSIAKDRIDVNNESIVDYAFSDVRSDFMDVFLSAKCDFFVSMISGIIILPEFFRRPIVYTNSLKISNMHSWISNSLTIFKLFYSNEKQRLLSFQEILEYGLGHVGDGNLLKSKKITIIDNTSTEISDVVFEMENRLSGNWKDDPEDLERQKSFWSIFGDDYLKSDTARVGTKFLKKYVQLLP